MSSSTTLNGVFLEEFVDTSSVCGVAYYKGIGCQCERLEFPQPAVLFPRGASVVDVEWYEAKRTDKARLTTSEFLVLPKGLAHAIRAEPSILDVFVVLPTADIFATASAAYHLASDAIEEMFLVPRVLERTVWINELQHRYFYERFVCRQTANAATTFLEAELAKEIYYLAKNTERTPTCAPALLKTNTIGKRAVAFVETHLFELSLTVDAIAKHARASRSTLERAFRNEVGRSPNEYIRDRRLDEANALIAAGKLPIGQIAGLVGYQNFSAFSQAFRRRWGKSPSQISGPKTRT